MPLNPRRLAAWEKAVKGALIDQIVKSNSISENTVSEWLWEDFGKKVRPDWDRLKRAILSDREITPQDLAVFMIENGVFPEEGAWDVMPRVGLRGGQTSREPSRGEEGRL
ncbi:MAG: hypothetical protein LRS48_04640 [Desulfurococcales archaeon]|nr:hypothetical protein [Desulfurococcales archaeon]